MLITLFFNLTYLIVSGFLSLFPNADLSLLSNISSAVSTASGYLSSISAFAPVATLIAIIGLFLAVELFILSVKIINWIIRKIPGIN